MPRPTSRRQLTRVDLPLVVNVHLRQPDEHPGQDAEELQVGARLPDLRTHGVRGPVSVPGAGRMKDPASFKREPGGRGDIRGKWGLRMRGR